MSIRDETVRLSPDSQDPQGIPSLHESTPRVQDDGMTRSQALNLYTSHFLSTWNIRTYEFAAVILTASAYPDTLVATSIRGIIRTLASICFASLVGRWVDRTPQRLKTLSATISVNRISVIGASALWMFIVGNGGQGSSDTHFLAPLDPSLKNGIFALIIFLGIFENLSASGNMLAMEREWVPSAANAVGQLYDLTHLNSVMRRIDLICKLIAPIAISAVISATSVKTGVLVVGTMSMISWPGELLCAKRAYDQNPRLRVPKAIREGLDENEVSQNESAASARQTSSSGLRRYVQDFRTYFASVVWVPSMSLSLLHISALTYRDTFITFLLNAGFSLDLITIARAAGSLVEISSTVVTPVGVQYLSKAKNHGRFRGIARAVDDSEEAGTGLLEGSPDREATTETGLERLGLWGVSFQLANLIPVVFALWSLSPTDSSMPPLISRIFAPATSQPFLAFILFFFLSVSRLGLWIFDLTTQQLTQTMNAPSQRSSFAGVENSFVSMFELAQYILAIVFHQQAQFKWIALASLGAVGVSTVAYAGWVWRMRGHLVHWEKIGKSCECVKIRLGHES